MTSLFAQEIFPKLCLHNDQKSEMYAAQSSKVLTILTVGTSDMGFGRSRPNNSKLLSFVGLSRVTAHCVVILTSVSVYSGADFLQCMFVKWYYN